MKKIFSIVILLCTLSLTGCIKSDPTLADVNNIISKIESQENAVVEFTSEEKTEYKVYSNDTTKKSSYTTNVKVTIANNIIKIETESTTSSSYGKTTSKTVSESVVIYDYNTNVCYTSSSNNGMYTQTTISTSTYSSFDYKYSTYLDTSFLSSFMGDTFITEYDKEYTNYTNYYSIYNTSSNNLTYNYEKVYNDDYDSSYFSYEYECYSTQKFTFKTSSISIPSSSKLLD